MAVANAGSGWEKKGTKFSAPMSTIATGAPTIEIRDANTEVWPTAGAQVTSFDVRAGGSPMIRESDYVVGRPEPGFTLRAPFSLDYYLRVILSLLQNASHDGSDYTVIPYTGGNVGTDGGFFCIQAGIAGNTGAGTVFEAQGSVCTSATITIPTSGSDGGRPEISSQWKAANAARLDDFSAAGTVSTDPISPSTEFQFQYGPSSGSLASKTLVSFDLTLSNDSQLSPNIGASADAQFLGNLTGSGNASVLFDAASAEEFDTLYTAYLAGTPYQLALYNSTLQGASDALIHVDAKLMEPQMSVQGNAIVASFPFEVANYNGNTRPTAIVTKGSISWPTE